MELRLGIYQHYKSKQQYKVMGVGFDTVTGNKVVIYQGLYNHPEFGNFPLFTRPLKEFEEKVFVKDKGHIDRFEFVGYMYTTNP